MTGRGPAGPFSRRTALAGLAAAALLRPPAARADRLAAVPEAYRTPHRLGRLVLERSADPAVFDSHFVDGPFVFAAKGRFYMTYYGFDGTGYQTGLAESDDLIHWRKRGILLGRDPSSPITRYNVALSSILREPGLRSRGRPSKVNGRYVASWNAYPSPGMEEGPAVIGLAHSDDLTRWTREQAPILRPEDGAEWEQGGLYRSFLTRDGDRFYLFYNAKDRATPWLEQIGVATSRDLRHWTRHPGNPILRVGPAGSNDSRFAANPFVVRHEGRWAMFYYGYAPGRGARDLIAIGDDPFHFDKVSEPALDVGPAGAVDETYAHKPSVIWHDGALYHFYCAVSGKWPNEVRGISVARSKPW